MEGRFLWHDLQEFFIYITVEFYTDFVVHQAGSCTDVVAVHGTNLLQIDPDCLIYSRQLQLYPVATFRNCLLHLSLIAVKGLIF